MSNRYGWVIVGLGLFGLANAGGLESSRIAGAGIAQADLALYGCDTATPPSGWQMLYVAPGGGGGGTPTNPFASIGAAYQSVGSSARVVLCVAAGSYQETLDFGTQRSVILVGGFANGFLSRSPASTPSQLRPVLATSSVISAQAPRQLTIDGFEVSGSERRGIAITLWDSAPPNNETVSVLNCHVHHNGTRNNPGGAAVAGGVTIGGGRYPSVVVRHNVIEENEGWHHGAGLNIGSNSGNPVVRDGGNDGFGSISSQVAGLATVELNLIRNNRLYETSLPHGAGAAVGMNAVVDHNEFSGNDTVSGGNHYGVGGGLIAQHGTSADTTNALIKVQHNWFEANRAGKAGSAVFLDQTHSGYVIGNVMVGNIGPGTVLVDGACSNSCAGSAGNHDRNFITVVSNTLVGNQGESFYVQDSTAHLYFNLSWNNANNGEDIRLAGGSPGADDLLRGRGNLLQTSQPGLLDTVSATGPGVVDAQYHLVSASVGGQALSTDDPQFTPAFTFAGSLYLNQMTVSDLVGAARLRPDGRRLFGAYAELGGDNDVLFADGFQAATP